MSAPIAIQLYTLRDCLSQDYRGTLTRLAELGYIGIETFSYNHGVPVNEAVKLIKDLGLTICSAHVGMPVGDNVQKVLDEAAATGCKRVISGAGREGFTSPDAIKATCDLFNQAAAKSNAEWLIVELDSCATDTMDAVGKSYRYLVDNKLAQGRK